MAITVKFDLETQQMDAVNTFVHRELYHIRIAGLTKSMSRRTNNMPRSPNSKASCSTPLKFLLKRKRLQAT